MFSPSSRCRDGCTDVRENGLLGEHNALALTGGAGGEDQKGHGPGINGSFAVKIGIFAVLGLTHGYQHLQIALVLLGLHIHRGFHERGGEGDNLGLAGDVFVAEEKAGVCLFCGVGQIFGVPFGVERDQNAANGLNGKIGQNPFIRKLAYYGTVFSGTPHLGKGTGESPYIAAKLAKADAGDALVPTALAEGIGPFISILFPGPFDDLTDMEEFVSFVQCGSFHDFSFNNRK